MSKKPITEQNSPSEGNCPHKTIAEVARRLREFSCPKLADPDREKLEGVLTEYKAQLSTLNKAINGSFTKYIKDCSADGKEALCVIGEINEQISKRKREN